MNKIDLIYAALVKSEPSFKQFTEQNKNKTIKQICEEYNIKSEIVEVMRKIIDCENLTRI